jgi:hypothetical protein
MTDPAATDPAATDPAATDPAATDPAATDPAAVLLDPEHVDELRRLLGTVEDWLLHASEEALDDLGEFLAGQAWSTTPAQWLTAALISELGEHTVLLRRALARPPGRRDE